MARKPMDFLEAEEQQTQRTVRRLQTLDEEWPEHLQLFSFSGSLMLIDLNIQRAHENECRCDVQIASDAVMWRAKAVRTDGGDPGTCHRGWRYGPPNDVILGEPPAPLDDA